VEAVIASLGWQGGKLRPTRVRKKIDKFSSWLLCAPVVIL
jgi:hypothetical protein